MSSENVVETDVLVIGGGIAGCFAAIKAREQGLDVTIVDKAHAGKSGAGIAANKSYMVLNPEWGVDFDTCMNEVTKNGEYINNREWTESILNDSLATYQDLVSWGVEFPRDALEFVKECAPFGTIRLLYRKLPPALRRQAEKVGVKVLDRIMVTELLKQDGKIVGAIGFPADSYDLYIFKAKATVMSGGSNSFKPAGYPVSMLTGDAEAMAYRAGAEITGKEFPDTHSTNARYPSAWTICISRGLLGPLPYFTDAEGERYASFLPPAQPDPSKTRFESDLAMDFVAHAGRGPILWDFGAVAPEDVEELLYNCQQAFGSPIEHNEPSLEVHRGSKIHVAGGAMAGYANVGSSGIWIYDTKCATGLAGLYAAGECCGTRSMGAYHPAPGFGLAGAAVTGKRAGAGAAEYASQAEKPVIDKQELARLKNIVYAPAERKGGFSSKWVTQMLQNTMIQYFVLHIKHGARLQAALTIVEFLRDHLIPKLTATDAHELRLAHETRNMVLNAEMILRSSLFRTESRGQHYREDYPRRDDPAWLAWTKMKEKEGRMKLSKEPVPKEWWPDLSQPYEERYPLRFPGE